MPRIETEEHAVGLTWIVAEPMARTFHALTDEGRVWLIDPLEVPELEAAGRLGEPAGVLQLLDRHNRDRAAVATRLGVPHLKVPDAVPRSPFEAIAVVRVPGWKETALWWPGRSTLVVAELLGSNAMYTGGKGGQRLGMHLFLRPFAPSSLRGMRPEHLLVGHGPGLHGPEVGDLIEAAHAGARRQLPRVLRGLPAAVRG